MSADGGLRALAFATPDGALWGAALDWGAGDDDSPALVLGSDAAAAGFAAGLRWTEGEDGSWCLNGDGTALTVTPLREPTADGTLCHLTGTITLDAEHAVDCPGVRVTLAPPRSARAAPASARLVAGFFANGTALGLLAARPGRSAHHDGDVIAAALFDAEESIAVREPRLSTTYDGDGAPTRTNLELWIGEGDDEFPRRAAGEASGPGGSVASAGGGALQVVPLRCHSRGEDGAGVYAIATF